MTYALFAAPGFRVEHVEKVLRRCREDGVVVSRVYAVVPERSLCGRAEAALREVRGKVCGEFGLEFREVFIDEVSVSESVGRLMDCMAGEGSVVLDLGGGMRLVVVYMLVAAYALCALGLLKDLRVYCVNDWLHTVVELPREFIEGSLKLYAALEGGGVGARASFGERLKALKKVCSGKLVYFEPRDVAKALGVGDRMARYVLERLEKLGVVERGVRRGYRLTPFGEALLEVCKRL